MTTTVTAIFVIFAVFSTVKCEQLPVEILQDIDHLLRGRIDLIPQRNCSEVDSATVVFKLYNRNDPSNPVEFPKTLSKPTKWIFHDWLEDSQANWMLQMKDALLASLDVDVVLVDWSKLSRLPYGESYCLVPKVAKEVAEALVATNIEQVHLIGFSMGAQLAGNVGREVKASINKLVGRITGLDPAKAFYCTSIDHKGRLNPEDASFVDVIHTDSERFGCVDRLGHVDFYVSCGLRQPGCPEFLPSFDQTTVEQVYQRAKCSHDRSVALYTESVDSEGFIAVACPDCALYDGCRINHRDTRISMGEHVPLNASGKYYLKTNFQAPFAKRTL